MLVFEENYILKQKQSVWVLLRLEWTLWHTHTLFSISPVGYYQFLACSYTFYSGARVNLEDEEGVTPLVLASNISGNPETIKLLLDHEADVLRTDREDFTALHVATTENNIKGVEVCICLYNVPVYIDSVKQL